MPHQTNMIAVYTEGNSVSALLSHWRDFRWVTECTAKMSSLYSWLVITVGRYQIIHGHMKYILFKHKAISNCFVIYAYTMTIYDKSRFCQNYTLEELKIKLPGIYQLPTLASVLPVVGQATGLDAWASSVMCPAQFMSYCYGILFIRYVCWCDYLSHILSHQVWILDFLKTVPTVHTCSSST